MDDLILGRKFEEILAMQQGQGTRTYTPGDAPHASSEDLKLFDELGQRGLEEKRFYGVLDRLKTSGVIATYNACLEDTK